MQLTFDRTFKGIPRSKCDCEECRKPCEWMPGYYLPEDLPRAFGSWDVEPTLSAVHEFVSQRDHELHWYFRASLAATVVVQGQAVQFGTLVPPTKGDGSCGHLSISGKCGVHELAPFGCAFFSSHNEDKELAKQGLMVLFEAWQGISQDPWSKLYVQIWHELARASYCTAPLPVRHMLYQDRLGKVSLPLAMPDAGMIKQVLKT